MGGSPAGARDLQAVLDDAVARVCAPAARGVRDRAYEPLEAGERTCGVLRGDEVLVAVATRDGAGEDSLAAPQGRWRDVLRGEQWTVQLAASGSGEVLGEHEIAVLERLGR